MTFLNSLVFIALVFLCAAPASAEATKDGMRYTRIYNQPIKPESSQIKTKTIKRDDEQPAEEEETPSNRIWNKYKALAAGAPEKTEEEKAAEAKAAEEEKTETAKSEQKDEEPKAVPEKVAAQPASPIAGLIEEYRRNKAQRSQMRTITVTKPADLQPAAGQEKPGT